MFKYLHYILHFIFVIIVLLDFSPAMSMTIDPMNSDKDHIIYGSEHECVLLLSGFYEGFNGKIPYSGSCVLIDNQHFLTAAHILHTSIEHYVVFKEEKYDCSYIVIHKNFMPKKNGFYDIALGKLKSPIKLNFYPELYDQQDEIGKISSQAGFGFPGDFATGYNKKTNLQIMRRAGSNIVAEIEKHLLICRNNDIPRTSLESLITPGDSGGGLFIGAKLAGIHSCVFATDGATDSDYGDESGHTRISNYIEWINSNKNLDLKIEK